MLAFRTSHPAHTGLLDSKYFVPPYCGILDAFLKAI